MEAMGEELRSNGLETIGGSKGNPEYDKEDCWFKYDDVANYPYDPEVKAVITGIDLKCNYSKIALASMYIQRGAKWIVTNEDAYTMTKGYRYPGNGSIIAAIESGLKAPGGKGLICEKIVTGKPNKAIVDLIRAQNQIPDDALSRMIMIGDRPDTDIGLAHNSGIASCLVLTGVVTSEEQVQQYAAQDAKQRPTYVIRSIGEDI